jgi:hypothetical protein
VLQLAGVGTLFGTLVAVLERLFDPESDTFLVPAVCGLAGAALGLVVVLVDGLP